MKEFDPTSRINPPACKGMDVNLFFPPKYERPAKEAVEACKTCPQLHACQEHAIAYEPSGFWGGLTSKQRASIRTKRGIKLRIKTETPSHDYCGTNRGYAILVRRRGPGEQVTCRACLNAHNAYAKEKKASA